MVRPWVPGCKGSGLLVGLPVKKGKQSSTALCEKLENAVATTEIVTHASITAKPFFEKRGYVMLKEQQVFRKGIALTNYIMEKKK